MDKHNDGSNSVIGPIRPPSEAYSFLIRITRNCPWNRCEFCSVFKGQTFELRDVEDIKKDILHAKNLLEAIRKWAGQTGQSLGDVARFNGVPWILSMKHMEALLMLTPW